MGFWTKDKEVRVDKEPEAVSESAVAKEEPIQEKLKANYSIVYGGDAYWLGEAMTSANNIWKLPNAAVTHFNMFPDENTPRLYVFNLSTLEFRVSRPPVFREIVIPGRVEGQEYSLAFSLPSPLLSPKHNPDSGSTDMIWEDTRRVVTDIINPNNLGIDLDEKRRIISNPTNMGDDLSVKGVFWSDRKTPRVSEIKSARIKMEKRYRDLIAHLWVMHMSGLVKENEITPEHRAAADYFVQDLPWHPRRPETEVVTKTQGD